MEDVLLAGEIQLHFDADCESGHLPGLQRELGEGVFQLPAQEVAIQLFYNDNNNGDDNDVTEGT